MLRKDFEILHRWVFQCSFGSKLGPAQINIICYQLKKTLLTFQLNAPVIIRVKVKKCVQTLLPFTAEDTCDWKSTVSKNFSSLPASSSWLSSNQCLHFISSTPPQVSSGFLHQQPLSSAMEQQQSPPSVSCSGFPMHAPLKLIFSIIPLTTGPERKIEADHLARVL